MNSAVTIVMYHYIRDTDKTPFPDIKALPVSLFEEQLQYIRKYYQVIRMEDLITAVINRSPLPRNALLLTFDDGYKDHYTTVFPLLNRYGVQGSFFPPAKIMLDHGVLTPNKIQFILASVKNKKDLLETIRTYIDAESKNGHTKPSAFYIDTSNSEQSRFDSNEVIIIKRLLQRDLPENFRTKITNMLFTQYVTSDEQSFSDDLYMTIEELITMKNEGMYIGSHGFDHYWLSTISENKQKIEIDKSLEFIKTIGTDIKSWAMCYPYGSYNDSLLSMLKSKHCAIGLTTDVGIADISQNPLLLPRLDTNDLPKNKDTTPNTWTKMVL